MTLVLKLINCFLIAFANRNEKSRLKYLRKMGAIVGEHTRFMNTPHIGEPYLIEIGNDCLISTDVHFHTHDGGVKVLNSAGFWGDNKMDKMDRIKIGNNCFVGSSTHIMGGVRIGNNCIIGACSVVTKDIPDNSVAAGIPAKIICTIEEYYRKNTNKFYPTVLMDKTKKKKYLIENVPSLK